MNAQESKSRLVITGGRVVTPFRVLGPGTVTVEEGKIVSVAEGAAHIGDEGNIVHAEGLTVAPGFIDSHVHGAMGHDTMDATPAAIEGMARFFARHGVTSFLPTTLTASRGATLAAIKNVTHCIEQGSAGAEILGIHLEGPYLSPEKGGAQPPSYIRPADPEEYAAFFQAGPVRLITLAPEIPENRRLIPYAVARGAAVAVGHSAATYAEVLEAVSLGLSQATHTFNAMGGLHHQQPGTAGAVLSCDDIFAQVIVDFIHIHPAIVKVLARAKGPGRLALITDAIRAAGMPDGIYDLGGQAVTVKDGEARLSTGGLAGSTLTMDRAVRNVMNAAGLSLSEALTMATITPAHSIGVADRKGSLEPGKDADLILLDAELQVTLTMVRGKVVYQAEERAGAAKAWRGVESAV
ncbi:MAG: N-acetylglucosamine-6-phosphate deacetylase [Chloroflexi bacterium HGW-Chloroflexi-1]|nr:MAG: N-acetylglucosamine-6-phosphate deacetylase [Chloroflexi bacterium HGW-Chloroflexi-1]